MAKRKKTPKALKALKSPSSEAELMKRSKAAWQTADQWEGILSDAYKFAMPQRDLYDKTTPGAIKGTEVFDSTAMISTAKFANRFVNSLFPANRTWCKLQAGPAVPEDKQDEINTKLEQITATAFTIIHNRSDFQLAIGEAANDVVIGTGVITTQKGTIEKPVNYQAIPAAQIATEEGPGGTVGAVFRKYRLPLMLIVPTWPDAKLPTEYTEEGSEKHEATEKIKLEEITYKDYKTGQWYYDVLMTSNDNSDKQNKAKRIVSRALSRNPFIVFRYMKAANETRGRGPLLQAMPDIKTANKLIELVLKNGTMAISGPYTVVDDGVVNPETISLKPMSFIPVARNVGHPAGPSIAPLERAGDFNIAYMEYERLQNSIKSVLLDEDLPPMTGQPRTAAEILERVRRLATDLGATYGRMVSELLIPIMQSTLDILEEQGIIDIPVVIDGAGVELVVTSPLAMQQNLDDVEAVVRAVEVSNALFGQEITRLAFKIEEIPSYIGRKLGMPEDLIRDDVERKALEKKIGEAAAAAEQEQPGAGLSGLLGQGVQGGPAQAAATG